MSNRDHLLDGLHSILEELWNGSDQAAASELRTLMTWRARAVKPFTPTYLTGTFPAPASQPAQESSVFWSQQRPVSTISRRCYAPATQTAPRNVLRNCCHRYRNGSCSELTEMRLQFQSVSF